MLYCTSWSFLAQSNFLLYSNAAIFGDKDISKCSYNLFLVVERTNRISLASFSDLQCLAHDQSCCLSGVVFESFVIRRSVSVYTIYS